MGGNRRSGLALVGWKGKRRLVRVSVHTGVPYLQAHDGVGIAVDDALGHERGANGRGDLRRVEGALAVPHDQGRLPNALRPEDHNLGLECGRHIVGGPMVRRRLTRPRCFVAPKSKSKSESVSASESGSKSGSDSSLRRKQRL